LSENWDNIYLELPVSIVSAWAEISAFAGYFAQGLFFRLKGFWPRLLHILCCDLMPRSQQFHEFWFETAWSFKLNVFQHHKKLNLSFLEISGTGIPARFAPIPAVSRQFPPVIVSTKFNILPELCRFAMHTASGYIRLQVVSATIHTF
jgi:hypothetical protein